MCAEYIFSFFRRRPQPRSTLFPYTTLFRSQRGIDPESEKAPRSMSAAVDQFFKVRDGRLSRSEEHTSELQSHHDLVCRLLLEKKKKIKHNTIQVQSNNPNNELINDHCSGIR